MKFLAWCGKGISLIGKGAIGLAKLCSFTFKYLLFFCSAIFVLSVFYYEQVANAINFFKNLF